LALKGSSNIVSKYMQEEHEHEEIKWQITSLAGWDPKGQHILSLSEQHP